MTHPDNLAYVANDVPPAELIFLGLLQAIVISIALRPADSRAFLAEVHPDHMRSWVNNERCHIQLVFAL